MMRAFISWLSSSARRMRLRGLSDEVLPRAGRPLVVGFFGAPSGIGTGGRLVLNALRDAGLNPAAADMTGRFLPGQDRVDWRQGREFPEDDGAGPVIVHANAPEVPYVLSELGRSRLEGRLRICFWAWEFERLPRRWARELVWFHECWAPSRFTADAIAARAGNMPVRAVGYPLVGSEPSAAGIAEIRARFAPGGSALVLHAFDMRSSMDRKNPLAAIEIFRRARRSSGQAYLVLKVSSSDWRKADADRLAGAIGDDDHIHILTESVSDREMSELVAAADVYLSPHRCEGFGLMLASTLMAGGEVMMTDWSGSREFADLPGVYPIGCTLVPAADFSRVYRPGPSRWAEPDIEEAAATLGRLLAPGRRRDRETIASAARERFATQRWLQGLGASFARHAQQSGEAG